MKNKITITQMIEGTKKLHEEGKNSHISEWADVVQPFACGAGTCK